MFKKINKILLLSTTALLGISGCKQIYDIPEERDYMSPLADFTRKSFGGENVFVLGRTSITQSSDFNADNSTFPIKFEIVNVRFGDGTPTTDILKKKMVKVWTKPYTGQEKSLAEIDAKRKEEEHPIFEIRSSGQFVLWSSSRAGDLRKSDNTLAVTDSEYIAPQKRRFFDVRMTNTGGERIVRNFELNVYRERPYEPSKDIEPLTGKPTGTFNHPSVSGIMGSDFKNYLSGESVDIFMRKVGTGRSLTFRFWNRDSSVIDPNSFDETKWDQLVHGFNMVKDSTKVRYDVAFPIPLAKLPTLYTGGRFSSGERANILFMFSRLVGKRAETGRLSYDFNIFEEGDWEMIFFFKTDNPKFEDE